MSPAQYQPLPQQDTASHLDVEQQIETKTTPHSDEEPRRTSTCTWKRLLVVAVVMAAGWQVSTFVVKHFARSLGAGTGMRLGTPCGGTHRNLSLGASLPTYYTLPSGDKIPSVALGVWQAAKKEAGQAVQVALEAGYRHIDGAWSYYNEEAVGDALRASGIPREQVWLTSKLAGPFHAPEDVEPALDDSLNKLGVEYLDLYLIHWPIAIKKGSNNEVDEALTANPYPTWQKLEEMVEKGKVRNIGVSNFNIPRLRNLTANPLKYKPAVNQVELSYWNPQPELLQWSKENDLLLEAYSPLGSGKWVKETLDVPIVKQIARALSITPAQVTVSWHVQRGTVVLPKSITPSRIDENLHVFKLPDALFDKLEAAAVAHPPRRVVNPSKGYNLGYDIFDDDGGVIVPDE